MPDRIEVFDFSWPVTCVDSGGTLRAWCAPWNDVQVEGNDYSELLPLLRQRLEVHLMKLACDATLSPGPKNTSHCGCH